VHQLDQKSYKKGGLVVRLLFDYAVWINTKKRHTIGMFEGEFELSFKFQKGLP